MKNGSLTSEMSEHTHVINGGSTEGKDENTKPEKDFDFNLNHNSQEKIPRT